MASILIKISGYLLIILLGAILRRIGFFKKELARTIGVLVVTVTLPASLIRNSPSIVIGSELPKLFLFAIFASSLTLFGGYLLAKRKREPKTAALMLSTSTFNVGAFLLPFVELFYPGGGVGYLCMFDSGNSIMGLGISYVLAKSASNPKASLTFGSILKTLLHSVPFMTYVVLFVLAFLQIRLSDFILEYAGMIGNANAFLTMFMIGLMIELKLPKAEIREICKVIALRYALIVLLIGILMILPSMDPFVKLIAALCLFAPVATASVVYAMECGYQGELVSMVSTLTMLISIAAIILIILGFGQSYIAI